jgi:membrane-bound metal-dependent hydrolase YbcI (DUF457 family)
MFVGHFAVGFAAKRAAPRTSLGALMMAPLLLDLLWPIALLLGVEQVRIDPGNTVVTPLDLDDYPYTHSLVTSIGWSLLMAAGVYALHKDRRGALVCGLGVFSHWVLDFVTHRPDLPLYPGGEGRVGLGLWNSLPGTLAAELALFAAGVWLYATTTRARDRVGAIAFWSFAALLLVFYFAALFGPLPPSPTAIAYTALTAWLFVPLAAWIDRHREVR